MEQAMIGTQEPSPEMIGKAGTDVEISGLYQQAQMICVFTLALPTGTSGCCACLSHFGGSAMQMDSQK